MNPYLNALASRIDIFHVQMIDCPHQVILVGGAATYEMTCIKFVSEAAELFEVILRSKSAEFYYSTLIWMANTLQVIAWSWNERFLPFISCYCQEINDFIWQVTSSSIA